MADSNSQLFELEVPLPDVCLTGQAKRLVGFETRYQKIRQDLRLLIDQEGLEKWSQKYYRERLPIIDALADRYPLVVFHGDVGTGILLPRRP